MERVETILKDGSIRFYGVHIVGLTPGQAAIKVREALVHDLYGFRIDEVTVTAMAPTAHPSLPAPLQ